MTDFYSLFRSLPCLLVCGGLNDKLEMPFHSFFERRKLIKNDESLSIQIISRPERTEDEYLKLRLIAVSLTNNSKYRHKC